MWLGWIFFEPILLVLFSFIIKLLLKEQASCSHVTCSTFLCLLISHTLLLAPNYINPSSIPFHKSHALLSYKSFFDPLSFSNNSSQSSRSVAPFHSTVYYFISQKFESNNLQVVYFVSTCESWIFFALLSLTDDWCQNYFLYTHDQIKIIIAFSKMVL
jgi:hypothetical protein